VGGPARGHGSYVHQRNESLAAGHGDQNVSYRALPDLERATGQGLVPLSRQLTSMSLAVIEHHPTGYLKVTAKSLVRSWDAPIYWQPERIRPAVVRSALKATWTVERPLRVAINLAFLCLGLTALSRTFRRYPGAPVVVALMATVGVVWIVQALLANGENGRYLFPYYPMIIVSLATGIDIWRRIRREPAPGGADVTVRSGGGPAA